MWAHISETTRSLFDFHWRRQRLRVVQHLLGYDVTANLICAFVISWLDYSNTLLAGLLNTTIEPLQRVINAAVRLVYGLRSRDHVSTTKIKSSYMAASRGWHTHQELLCLLIQLTVIGQAATYIKPCLKNHCLLIHYLGYFCFHILGGLIGGQFLVLNMLQSWCLQANIYDVEISRVKLWGKIFGEEKIDPRKPWIDTI